MEIEKFRGEPTDSTANYLQIEDFENLNLPEILPAYTGKGSKSTVDTYDAQKMEYLNDIGVQIPDNILDENGKVRDRALLVTMFIVTGLIVASEDVRRECGENHVEFFKDFLNDRNLQLEEARLDKFGYRRVLPSGNKVEDIFGKYGFSNNPEKRVSREELNGIVRYVFGQFKKES